MDPSSFPQPNDRIAYLGRVSTPKQKLEHQRAAVLRFAEDNRLIIPKDLIFEDKVRRHKQESEGQEFGRLMKLVEARKIDWVIIATFDRWGISNMDDIFVLRQKLRRFDVNIWSVADELNITGADDSSFWRVAARAEGATAYVSSQAEKNIQKMVWMAEQGWAATGNAPYGLDLVCYPINDQSCPLFRVVRLKYIRPHLYRILWYRNDGSIEKEEVTERMPPRDKKATGYRLRPSVELDRLQTVKLIFDLYEEGLGFGAISRKLWSQGRMHYDRPFGYHGIETILSNSAYIGMPAWGKVGVGQYRHAVNKTATKIKRKSTDTISVKKPEEQYVYPLQRVFDPIVDLELFGSVKVKLKNRGQTNAAFGKRRIREKSHHPLNGKLVCPDCDKPMVLGSYTPRSNKAERKKTRCFHCGTWRKSIRTQCFANTVSWDKLDNAINKLLLTVADRIAAVEAGDPTRLQNEVWLHETELGKIIDEVVAESTARLNSPEELRRVSDLLGVPVTVGLDLASDLDEACDTPRGLASRTILEVAFGVFERGFAADAVELKRELQNIDEELCGIALELPKQRSKPTIYGRLEQRAQELEIRKAEIEPRTIPLTSKAKLILEQLNAIKRTIMDTEKARQGELLETFLEKVIPIFEIKTSKKDNVRRAYVKGFTFIPKKGSENVMPQAMEIGYSRTDMGSKRQST